MRSFISLNSVTEEIGSLPYVFVNCMNVYITHMRGHWGGGGAERHKRKFIMTWGRVSGTHRWQIWRIVEQN